MAFRFEWDEAKASANRIKHGVNFDEATTVFEDSLARIFDDEPHSTDEKREIVIGRSVNERILLVCFTARPDERIRIISARLPTPKERKAYEKNI
jgi:uncharacterized DUF497 family protein